MLLVEKRGGTTKEITCADEIKQRSYESYNNHDCVSPNCSNNSVMIMSELEAKEGRDVDIIDIPGAYLHTYVDKHGKKIIIVMFRGNW